jgi:hypothetical protein
VGATRPGLLPDTSQRKREKRTMTAATGKSANGATLPGCSMPIPCERLTVPGPPVGFGLPIVPSPPAVPRGPAIRRSRSGLPWP